MEITFDHAEDVARNTKTFWFRAEPKPDYIAGQFIEMFLPHQNADERGQKHWFTLSSSPTEELISITTKHAVDHVSTFKKVLFELAPGAKLTVSEPMGDFVLPKDTAIPLLFVAGGIGVTPVRSMLKWLTDQNQRRPVQIIYGVRTIKDTAFRSLFEAYGAGLDIILSEPPLDWTGYRGHINADTILNFSTPETLIYISGPEPMVEILEADLLKTGIPGSKLVLDFFPGYKSE